MRCRQVLVAVLVAGVAACGGPHVAAHKQSRAPTAPSTPSTIPLGSTSPTPQVAPAHKAPKTLPTSPIAPSPSRPVAPVSPSRPVAPVWLVTAPSLNGLLAYASSQPGGTAVVTTTLDHPSTYVMTGTSTWPIPGDNSIPAGWNVTHAVITPDLAGVRECAAQQVPCVFDLEYPVRRNQNPVEQANPVATFQQARAIMGTGQLVAVPGINLVAKDGTRFGKFVTDHLAGQIAPYVNSYAIQAQELEHARVLGWTYPSFVGAIASQIPAGVHVLGVLRSVSSNGVYDPPNELTTAYRATTPVPLSGFWLAISILPYPWTNRAPPNYSIPYQFLQSIS